MTHVIVYLHSVVSKGQKFLSLIVAHNKNIKEHLLSYLLYIRKVCILSVKMLNLLKQDPQYICYYSVHWIFKKIFISCSGQVFFLNSAEILTVKGNERAGILTHIFEKSKTIRNLTLVKLTSKAMFKDKILNCVNSPDTFTKYNILSISSDI